MLTKPRFPLPAADLIPPAPELRFQLAAAQVNVGILRRLLKLAEAAESAALPAVVARMPSPAGAPAGEAAHA